LEMEATAEPTIKTGGFTEDNRTHGPK
jgi:hypothetical protein